MPTLSFSGYSDDTFGEYEHFRDDYDCCANGRPIVFKLTANAREGSDEQVGMYVYGQYSGRDFPKGTPACWMIGVQQLDDDKPFPWPMRFESDGYTPVLLIEAPEGVRMECMNAKKDD
jgi:hypothetical protein